MEVLPVVVLAATAALVAVAATIVLAAIAELRDSGPLRPCAELALLLAGLTITDFRL